MKKVIMLIFSAFVAFSAYACGDNTPKTDDDSNSTGSDVKEGAVLIVYFSRAGGNYPNNTYLTLGRTAVMANFIQEYTGGTLFEIVPAVSYPDDYEEMKVVSQRETNSNARPAIKNPLENLDKYSVVFIGCPIWCGAPPMIMRAFYEAYPELANKTIVPFGTHEGSGIASCAALIKEYFPKATVLESYGVVGQRVNDANGDIVSWLRRIGIKEK